MGAQPARARPPGSPTASSRSRWSLPGGGAGTAGGELGIAVPTPVPDPDIGRGYRALLRSMDVIAARIITGSITAGISSHGTHRRRIGPGTAGTGAAGTGAAPAGAPCAADAPRGCGCRLGRSGEGGGRRLGGRRPGRYYGWYRREITFSGPFRARRGHGSDGRGVDDDGRHRGRGRHRDDDCGQDERHRLIGTADRPPANAEGAGTGPERDRGATDEVIWLRYPARRVLWSI